MGRKKKIPQQLVGETAADRTAMHERTLVASDAHEAELADFGGLLQDHAGEIEGHIEGVQSQGGDSGNSREPAAASTLGRIASHVHAGLKYRQCVLIPVYSCSDAPTGIDIGVRQHFCPQRGCSNDTLTQACGPPPPHVIHISAYPDFFDYGCCA